MGASSTDTSLDASISNSSKKKSQAKQAAGGYQPHGNLTPAHTDGCAARCFEGVQCGSIIIGGNGHGRQSTALLFRRFFIARSRKEVMAETPVWLALARTYLLALFRAAIAALFNVQHRLLISLHQPSSL